MAKEKLFFRAVIDGDIEQVKHYLKEGVDIQYSGTYNGRSRFKAFDVAIDKGFTEIADLLSVWQGLKDAKEGKVKYLGSFKKYLKED